MSHPTFATWRRRQALDHVLLQRVLTFYPEETKPGVVAASHPPTITAGPMQFSASLTIYRIFGIDQRAQTYNMHYKVRAMWRDCRLLSNCTWLMMNDKHPLFRSLWMPPFFIEEEEGNDGDMYRGNFAFSPEGDVFATEERVGRFRCGFNFRDMPFDRQACSLTFSGNEGAATVSLRLLRGADGEAIFVKNIANAEWKISGQDEWRAEELTLTRELYNARKQVSALRYTFELERRSRSMVMNHVLPSIMFYLVSWLGLWIDPAAVPARAAIGVIPVLIMTNKLSSFGASIPPISYPVRLESFLIATLTFIVLQMMEFGFVNYGLRRSKAAKEQAARAQRGDEDASCPPPRHSVVAEGAAQALALPDRIAMAFGTFTDTHFRWVSLLAYFITAMAILLS